MVGHVAQLLPLHRNSQGSQGGVLSGPGAGGPTLNFPWPGLVPCPVPLFCSHLGQQLQAFATTLPYLPHSAERARVGKKAVKVACDVISLFPLLPNICRPPSRSPRRDMVPKSAPVLFPGTAACPIKPFAEACPFRLKSESEWTHSTLHPRGCRQMPSDLGAQVTSSSHAGPWTSCRSVT